MSTLFGIETDIWQAYGAVAGVVVAVGALVASGVAILISHRQTKFIKDQLELQRNHNKLSVKPHLQWSRARNWADDGGRFKVSIQNTGFGPAKLLSLRFFLDGVEFKVKSGEELDKLIAAPFAGKVPLSILSSSLPSKDFVIDSKTDYVLAHVFFPMLTRKDAVENESVVRRIDLVVEFESFYGEKDVLDSRINL